MIWPSSPFSTDPTDGHEGRPLYTMDPERRLRWEVLLAAVRESAGDDPLGMLTPPERA